MLKVQRQVIILVVITLCLFISCKNGDKLSGPLISFQIPKSGYKIEIGKTLPIAPIVVNDGNSTYSWSINGKVVSSSKTFSFAPSRIGNYTLQLKVSNDIGSDDKMIQIAAFSNHSPYITQVFDYQYGPGQNATQITSDCKGGDFIGEPWINSKKYTSLGGWGGYILAGFDHDVRNGDGVDFAIFTQPGPGSEPGIVSVMNDFNNDGIPNDGEWLELKGSEYNHPETIHNYRITYYKPALKGNVTWKDNQGHRGELMPNYGTDTWWWSGNGNKSEVSYDGVRLPNAYVNISADSTIENWAVRKDLFSFGYAECYSNLDYNISLKANLFDISNAVDNSGVKQNLMGISFIKVQSAIFQVAGWLNEISPEISGAADLSLIEYSPN